MDFYCPALKLVIEVDGASHHQQEQYDHTRTEQLQTYGYQVLRFSNEAVLNDLPTVLISIQHYIAAEFSPELGS